MIKKSVKKISGIFLSFIFLTVIICCANSNSHIHTYSEAWTSDENYHWHVATCEHADEINGKEEHTFGDFVSNNDATTEKDGTKSRFCSVCGYEEKVTDVGSKIHVHTYSDAWTSDENYHWHVATCEHSEEKNDYSKHSWDDGIITETATCTANGVKTYTCAVCKKTKEEVIPAGHSYNSSYVCTVCNTVKTVTVGELDSAVGHATKITADSSKPGITRSEDRSTVNIYGVKVTGEFSSKNHVFKTVVTADLTGLDTSEVTNMSYMFSDSKSLTELNISNLDTSNVTSMYSMFDDCEKLTNVDLSHFDTSKVTDMRNMFYNCTGLLSLDVSSFDTSNVTSLRGMFFNCSKLSSLDLSCFNTSKVIELNYLFAYCSNLESVDVHNFDTSNVTDMSCMFYECEKLGDFDLSNFRTQNVKNMSYMFYYCTNLENLDLSYFDTTKVTSMIRMFASSTELKNLKLNNFSVNDGISMNGYHKSAVLKTPIKKVDYDTIHKRIQRTGNFIV